MYQHGGSKRFVILKSRSDATMQEHVRRDKDDIICVQPSRTAVRPTSSSALHSRLCRCHIPAALVLPDILEISSSLSEVGAFPKASPISAEYIETATDL